MMRDPAPSLGHEFTVRGGFGVLLSLAKASKIAYRYVEKHILSRTPSGP